MSVKKTNNGKKGGVVGGKKHSQGGVKTIVTDDNRPVEIESGEVIITAPAVKKHWKLLDKINRDGGGVEIHAPQMKQGGNAEHIVYYSVHYTRNETQKQIDFDTLQQARVFAKEINSKKSVTNVSVRNHIVSEHANPRLAKSGANIDARLIAPKGTIFVKSSSHRGRNALDYAKIKRLPISSNNSGYKSAVYLIYEKDRAQIRNGGMTFMKSLGYGFAGIGDKSLEKLFNAQKELTDKENQKREEKYRNSDEYKKEAQAREENKKRVVTQQQEAERERYEQAQREKKERNDQRLMQIESSKSRSATKKTNLDNQQVDRWDEIPAVWKRTKNVSAVKVHTEINDTGLVKLSELFCGNDILRPVMSCTFFDESGICVTDAHRMLFLQGEHLERGSFVLTKSAQKHTGLALGKEYKENKFPNYKAVVPNENSHVHKIDVQKLFSYCRTCRNYYNKTTHKIGFRAYDDGDAIGVNGEFLESICEALLMLDCSEAYVGYSSPNRAMVFTSDEKVAKNPHKAYNKKDAFFILQMPVMLMDEGAMGGIGAEDLDYNYENLSYFDFTDNEIHNADGSIATYNKDEVLYPEYITKEIIDCAKEFQNKSNVLPILDYVAIENGKMTISDLETNVVVDVSERIENGCYQYVDNYLRKVIGQDVDEYPRLPEIKDAINFCIVSSSRLLAEQLELAHAFAGRDQFRPVDMSVKLALVDNSTKLQLSSTDQFAIFQNEIFAEGKKEHNNKFFLLGGADKIVAMLKNFDDQPITIRVTETNCEIVGDNFKIITRNYEGKFANIDSVLCSSFSKYNSFTINAKTFIDAFPKQENKHTGADFKATEHSFSIGDKLINNVKINAEERVGNVVNGVMLASVQKNTATKLAKLKLSEYHFFIKEVPNGSGRCMLWLPLESSSSKIVSDYAKRNNLTYKEPKQKGSTHELQEIVKLMINLTKDKEKKMWLNFLKFYF